MIARLLDPWFEAAFVYDVEPSGKTWRRRAEGPLAGAQGLFLFCPCGYPGPNAKRAHGLLVPFTTCPAVIVRDRNGGAPKWSATGTSLADLTVHPSVDVDTPSCWHGWIVSGEVR